MQLALHTGAHFTEQERLIKTLLRNNDAFSRRGIHVPGPNSYRGLVRDTLNAMSRAPAAPDAREVLLDVILNGVDADRIVLSDANFFRTAGTAIQKGSLYPAAAARMGYMAALFPDDEIEIFLGLRNPATLIPRIYQNASHPAEPDFWAGRGPHDIRWRETVTAIRAAVPEVPITVWCSEDLPLIWSQVVREIAGIEVTEKIVGGFDLLGSIMTKEGMERFRSYLHNHPDMSEIQKRRVISAFLDKFALDDAIEEELDMPGWTEALVDDLTELYEEDVFAIERLPGVTLIAP